MSKELTDKELLRQKWAQERRDEDSPEGRLYSRIVYDILNEREKTAGWAINAMSYEDKEYFMRRFAHICGFIVTKMEGGEDDE